LLSGAKKPLTVVQAADRRSWEMSLESLKEQLSGQIVVDSRGFCRWRAASWVHDRRENVRRARQVGCDTWCILRTADGWGLG
jgi:hypothetical protein